MNTSSNELLLEDNQTLKQKIYSLNTENILLKQKLNYLNKLCAENTMKYRNIESANKNLQIQFEFIQQSYLKLQQNESRKYDLLEKENQILTNQLATIQIEHDSTLHENNKYKQQNKSFNETCKENEKLRKQNTKYENDLKSIQKQHTTDINVLTQAITELREQLETQSEAATTPIQQNEPINPLQNIHSFSIHSASNSTGKPMIRPILSNSAANYSISSCNSMKVRLYNRDSDGNRTLNLSKTIGTPTDNDQKLTIATPTDIYAEVPDIDYDCLQVLNEEIFDCDIGITIGNYNRLYPFLCKVFIENTGCCRVPKKSDLENIILKYGATKTTRNVKNKYTVTIKEKMFTKFWQWFKECCVIVKELSYLWDFNEQNAYLCNLFCGREQSQEILNKQGDGTFIIRIATSRKGGIVFTYFDQMSNKIVHSLYIRKGINQYVSECNINASRPRTVSQIVKTGNAFRFMYTPSYIHPKNNVF
eukprot:280822_1